MLKQRSVNFNSTSLVAVCYPKIKYWPPQAAVLSKVNPSQRHFFHNFKAPKARLGTYTRAMLEWAVCTVEPVGVLRSYLCGKKSKKLPKGALIQCSQIIWDWRRKLPMVTLNIIYNITNHYVNWLNDIKY